MQIEWMPLNRESARWKLSCRHLINACGALKIHELRKLLRCRPGQFSLLFRCLLLQRLRPTRPNLLPLPTWTRSTRLEPSGFPKIGATLMVLGISYLIKLAVQHGWITPIMLFCGAIALCLGLIGFGQWKQSEQEEFGQIVTGIGTCGMFITFAGGHIYQNLYSGETLVGLFLGWSLVNLTYAWWRGSRSFLGIGLFGGLIACWMPVQKDAFNLSLAFHALMALSTLAIVVRHRWPLMACITWLSVLVSALPICMLASNEWLVRVIFVEGLGILATLAFIFASDAEEGKEKIAAILTMIGLSTRSWVHDQVRDDGQFPHADCRSNLRGTLSCLS